MLRALVSLEGNSDFELVLGWMRESKTEINKLLATHEHAPKLHQCQGAYQVVDRFVEIASNPRKSTTKRRIGT